VLTSGEIVSRALAAHTVVPAFNVPYLPMMEPIVRAVRDADSFAFIDVARLEWIKFEAGGPEDIKREYDRHGDPRHTRLHLDHIPVIDEDDNRVDYLPIIREALKLGYDSVMVDGSRLPLHENIAATRAVCEAAHTHGVPVEGELGAVLGHEAGPMPPYEELFASGKGFTDPDEAQRFVAESGVDWLSIAFGNIHGPITPAERKKEKVQARLAIDHLVEIRRRVGIPIVLHGGSGIRLDNVLEAIRHGVAKINIASDLRRPYEALKDESPEKAAQVVYEATAKSLRDLELQGNAAKLATS
jgi:ketose-bisphosphate aldolase